MYNGDAFSVAARYVKLHTGNPGVNASNNAAANTTRKQMNNAVSASQAVSNPNDLAWTNVPNAETYTHFSVWDASTGGNPIEYGELNGGTGYAVNVGNNFTIPTGDLDFTAVTT